LNFAIDYVKLIHSCLLSAVEVIGLNGRVLSSGGFNNRFFRLVDLRSSGHNEFVQVEVLLANSDVCVSVDTPRVSPSVFDNPEFFVVFVLTPTEDLKSVTALESGGTFNNVVDTFLVDQEVSVNRDNSNNGTVLKDFSLNGLRGGRDTVVKNEVLLAGSSVVGASGVTVTSVRNTGFINDTFLLGVIKETSNSTTFAVLAGSIAGEVSLRAEVNVLAIVNAESVGKSAGGSDGVTGRAVSLVLDGVNTVRVLSSEIVAIFNDSGFIRRGTSHEGRLEGELVVEKRLGIRKFQTLEEGIGTKSETKVVSIVSLDIFLINNWSKMDLL
jgi:hypothetical protein